MLILSEILPGEYEIKNFINELKNINPYLEIVFFMKEENEELKNFLIGNGVKKIYVDGEFSLSQIINGICFVNTEKDLNLEIEKLKKLIEENSNFSQKSDEETRGKSKAKISETIAVTGYYGSGKSLFTAMLAKAVSKMNLKVIVIDFDIFNNSLSDLFNISKYNKNINFVDNLDQYIIKFKNNISIFAGIDVLFNEKNKINFEKVKSLFDKLKEDYDLILIDTSSETNLKYVKTILANVQKIVFLIEPNLVELKKSKELLEIYLEDWEIPEYKFNIVLNKTNVNSIDEDIIKNIFSNIKIIGKIDLSKSYTSLANDIKTKVGNLKDYENILNKMSK